jgi:hypothetical protein
MMPAWQILASLTRALPFILLLLSLGCARSAAPAQPEPPAEAEHHHEGDAVEAMAGSHHHHDLHMKWTQARPATAEDRRRADAVVAALRGALGKYRDYRVAIAEGFEPFLPDIRQPHYHFTRKWNGFKAAFGFDPAAPTSLLYRKTGGGYELLGAMYTAPKGYSEQTLDERVPLSVARWHAHVNLCFPPRKADRTHVDWTRFGFKGSIATEAECDRAGGRFYPQVFGWMLHVYPFEQETERIWAHEPPVH